MVFGSLAQFVSLRSTRRAWFLVAKPRATCMVLWTMDIELCLNSVGCCVFQSQVGTGLFFDQVQVLAFADPKKPGFLVSRLITTLLLFVLP